MSDLLVKIYTEGATPAYETEGSSGMDLRAHVEEPVVISPGKWAFVPTGVHIELPIGYEAQIRARSGLASKFGIALVNGVGTIDSDYRGEIRCPMINFGEEPFVVNDGDRIAQMIVAKYEHVVWEGVSSMEELSETSRGAGGFGHTGI
jgi:dUTP pyrophosphatase